MFSISFAKIYKLFPAHAGVIPTAPKKIERRDTIPRTRGGDPSVGILNTIRDHYSPHTRG